VTWSLLRNRPAKRAPRAAVSPAASTERFWFYNDLALRAEKQTLIEYVNSLKEKAAQGLAGAKA
jgi:hypothetical protein